MDQATFSELEHDSTKRRTRREEFLARMDELIPWERLQQRGRAVLSEGWTRTSTRSRRLFRPAHRLPGDEPWFRRRRCFASGRGPDPRHLAIDPLPDRACGAHGHEPVFRDNQDEKVPSIKVRKPMSRALGGRFGSGGVVRRYATATRCTS